MELKYSEQVYSPREDSRLLQKVVEKYMQEFKPNRILDMGTGSGIQAIAAKKSYSNAEQVAKKKQVGLWGDKNPTPPWKWRRDKRLKVLYQTCTEKAKGCKEKKYAKELGIDVEQLKGFLDEAIKNEDKEIKKAFEASGLEEEEFATEFKVSPERLKNILNPK